MAERAQKLKVLLVGHACAPDLGSEPGLTWNWAWHLSEHHEVWVVAHPQHRAAVDAVTARHGDRAPRMVWVDLPKRLDPWDPTRGERGLHLHYLLWQKAAFAQARRLLVTHRFDIVHHVSWGTVNSAPELWRLKAPFVWGPLGGGQAAPLRFSRYLGGRGALTEAGRSLRQRLAPLLPSLRRAAANSALVLATNQETADILYKAGAPHVELFYDNGVLPDQFVARRRVRGARDRLELLWVGRLEGRKALPLALAAVARVRELPLRLSIAGDGPLRAACERQVQGLGLAEMVRFLGVVPRARLLHELYATSDALIFTSLQDSAGSVTLEAMAAGLPVLGLDHQGAGLMMPGQAAIKVPVLSPGATIHALAEGIRSLAASPDLGRRLGEAAREHAATESWSRRVARMNGFYGRVLAYRRALQRQGDGRRAQLSEALH